MLKRIANNQLLIGAALITIFGEHVVNFSWRAFALAAMLLVLQFLADIERAIKEKNHA